MATRPWTPADMVGVTGLEWFDSTQSVTTAALVGSDTPVSQWTALRPGGGTATKATSARDDYRPFIGAVNGKQSVYFNANTRQLPLDTVNLPAGVGNKFWFIASKNMETRSGDYYPFGYGASGGTGVTWKMRQGQIPYSDIGGTGLNVGTLPIATTGISIITEAYRQTGALTRSWYNGQASPSTLTATRNSSAANARLGSWPQYGNGANQHLLRIGWCYGEPSDDDIVRLQGWMSWDTGDNGGSLPDGHAYKTAAPTVSDGASGITAISSSALGSVAVASSALVALLGAAAITLTGIGSTSTASAPIAAQAQASLGAIISAGAGGISVAGAGAATLQAISTSSAGALPVVAASATPLGDVTSSATALLSVAGTLSSTLGPVGTVSAARADVRGVASTSLGSIVGSATAGGQSLATASSVSMLGSIATAATTSVPVVGIGSIAFATIASNSGAASAVRGAGSASLGSVVSSSASSIPIGAIGAANLSGVRADGRGGAIVSAIASSTFGGIVAASSATVGQDTDNQLVGPGWTLFATPRRFVASAIRRSFIVSSTGCKRMLNFPPKYAHEVRNAVVDFAPALSEGEGLTGPPTVAVMKGDLSVSAARIEGTAVHFTLSGGTAATKVVQWVEVHCQTNGDQVLEEVVSVTMLS